MPRKHSHYFKPTPFEHVDVYRVLQIFNVTDPCLQHALKKLLVAGGRGVKDQSKDVGEAIDTLQRWQEMRMEDAHAEAVAAQAAGPTPYVVRAPQTGEATHLPMYASENGPGFER